MDERTSPDLESLLESIAGSHSDLDARLRTVKHALSTANLAVHVHYCAFRGTSATVPELVQIMSQKLIRFALHRTYVEAEIAEARAGSSDELLQRMTRLYQEAVQLFIKANKNSNRNGELGELLVYALIEKVLRAPQYLAKLSLKTNANMPVHGSDGIHVRYDTASKTLHLYWGEAKCYSSINAALDAAAKSLIDNLTQKKMDHEVFLITQNFDRSGLDQSARDALLDFLDPYTEASNKRRDTSVVLIAFDYGEYEALHGIGVDNVDAVFCDALSKALPPAVSRIGTALAASGLGHHHVELFFLPVPSVQELRDYFQNKIGWAP